MLFEKPPFLATLAPWRLNIFFHIFSQALQGQILLSESGQLHMGMTLEELTTKVAALKNVAPAGDSRTLMYKVPFSEKATSPFVRPLGEDLLAAASVIGLGDDMSIRLGKRILDAAEPHVAGAKRANVKRLTGIGWGLPGLDALVMFGPAVAQFRMTKDDFFLSSRTVVAYPINHMEFSGDETEAEASVRENHMLLADVAREITPVIFLRYHKQTVQRSAERLAIARHSYTTKLIQQMPQDGGTVELENYERSRMSLVMAHGTTRVDVTFAGKTASISTADALKLMDTLTMKGAEEAKKGW